MNKGVYPVCEFNISCRHGTCDRDIATSIIFQDEYRLRDHAVPGGVFVDLGAYCGHASVLLASLGMTGIALEPIRENVEMMAENLLLNGVSGEVRIEQGCLGADHLFWKSIDQDSGTRHQFIGNCFGSEFGGAKQISVRDVSLEELLEGHDKVDLLKTDCEGGEWALMKSPRHVLNKIELIVGEFHPVLGPYEDFIQLTEGFKDVSGEFGYEVKEGMRLFALRKA